MSSYRDEIKCPRCKNTATIYRRTASIGKKVATYCSFCRHTFKVIAGKPRKPKP